MNNNELLNRLLGIQKLHVLKSDFIGEEKLHLEVVSNLSVASCPDCRQVSHQVHDESEAQMIRDLSIAERQCFLVYRARRFKCEHCKKTFVERVEWKRSNVSYTERYEHYVYQRVRRESISLADCYLQLGELEKAREHLNLALDHFNECGNTVYLPYVYDTLADIHLRGGELKQAKASLDSGIQSALEHNMFSALNNLLADTAHYYILLGDGTRSAVILNYVLESTDTIKEGRDKASKLEGEIIEKFGAEIWGGARKASMEREAILKLVG